MAWIDHYEATQEIKKAIIESAEAFPGTIIDEGGIETIKNTIYKALKKVSDRHPVLDMSQTDFDINVNEDGSNVTILPNNSYTRELIDSLKEEA